MCESTKKPDETTLLRRLWAIFSLLLVVVTLPLWFSFPGIPAIPAVAIGIHHFPSIRWLPELCYVVPSCVMVASLLLIVVSPEKHRSAWWVVAICLLASFLLDQHRMQPWAYQSAVYAVVFAAIRPARARRYLIPLAASVYIYSAAGKFDFQFTHTVGQDFLEALSRPFGGIPDQWNESTRAKLALIFPSAELLCGIGLLLPRTRIRAAALLIVMHATLILVLGPWALNHSNGVLVWNVLLIVQAYVLVIRPERHAKSIDEESVATAEVTPRDNRIAVGLANVVVVCVLAGPILERWGYWDHWTSWSLYSPHTSRVEIEIHRSATDSLPSAVQTFLHEDENEDGWRPLAIEQWSLQSRGVPIYPQARYQLALASQIATQLQLSDEIRARCQSISDRWTGRRDQTRLLGNDEIRDELKKYWLSGPAAK